MDYKPNSTVIGAFNKEDRDAVYQAIFLRRDIRHFRNDPIEEEVLQRILLAGHHAPSVGFSQPWGFVLVQSTTIRQKIRANFLKCRELEASRFPPERRAKYLKYRLEGIIDTPLNLCVCVDQRFKGEPILGTTVQPQSIRGSAVCAVQNIWLAARSEGVGVGWVSIVEPHVLRQELKLPEGVDPVAYLCLGYTDVFDDQPMLQSLGWKRRKKVEDVIYHDDSWGEERSPVSQPSIQAPTEPADAKSLCTVSQERVRQELRLLTKPEGSLGKLEDLLIWYSGVRGEVPQLMPKSRLVVFAADHGVVAEGITPYSSDMTSAVYTAIARGKSAINVLCQQNSVELEAVDVGIGGDLSLMPKTPSVAMHRQSIKPGTANAAVQDAMSLEEFSRAWKVGETTIDRAHQDGIGLFGLGELGIGNTTTASALACALLKRDPFELTGIGSGIPADKLRQKSQVIERIIRRVSPEDSVKEILRRIGGFEMVAMVSAVISATDRRIPVVVDGMIAQVAAYAAGRLRSHCHDFVLFAHTSPEPLSQLLCKEWPTPPVLVGWNLRLGEGTGAAIVMGQLRSAIALLTEMGRFQDLGVDCGQK